MNIMQYIDEFEIVIPFNRITIHHSKTKDGVVADWTAIRKWHKGEIGSAKERDKNYNPYIKNPMVDIGYHFGIELINSQYEYLLGRSIELHGAHTKGFNKYNLGICVVGDFDFIAPTPVQYNMLARLCRNLMIKFDIDLASIYFHRDFSIKTCPGVWFSKPVLRDFINGSVGIDKMA